MKVAKIRTQDIANGPGIRASIYVQGCTRHCPDCFNQETWDFNDGHVFSQEIKERFIKLGEKESIVGFSILGGEPLQQDEDMLNLLREIRSIYGNTKSIWMWTGYKYEMLSKEQHEVVKEVDVLVDGEFVSALINPNNAFMGSCNQRLIDIHKTIEQGSVVLYKL